MGDKFDFDVSSETPEKKAMSAGNNSSPKYPAAEEYHRRKNLHQTQEQEAFRRKTRPERRFADEAADWLKRVSYIEFENEICKRVVGQEDLKTLTLCVYNYLECLAKNIPVNTNVLIAAPSGSGKTETFRAMKDYFKTELPCFPIGQIDMTSITEEGYKGKNTIDLIRPLIESKYATGEGIIFMDEIDKKMMPSYSSSGTNVNLAVMSQLLTTIEGTIFRDKMINLDTSRAMFIGLGSFDACRRKRQEKDPVVGFGQDVTRANAKADHFEPITREDMIRLGATPEFVGRFTTVLNYQPLNSIAVNKIITMYLYSLKKRFGVQVTLSPALRDSLAGYANTKYGCRYIETKLIELAMPAYRRVVGASNRDDLRIHLGVDNSYKIFERLPSQHIQ